MKISMAIKIMQKVYIKRKLVDKYAVTDASVLDSQPLNDFLTEEDKGQDLHATLLIRAKKTLK